MTDTQLAEAAELSVSYFRRLFKIVTGVTPKDYAAAHRASRVREELAKGHSVTAAMYDAGFNSSGRFYEKSTSMLGMTPTPSAGSAPTLCSLMDKDYHPASPKCRRGSTETSQRAVAIEQTLPPRRLLRLIADALLLEIGANLGQYRHHKTDGKRASTAAKNIDKCGCEILKMTPQLVIRHARLVDAIVLEGMGSLTIRFDAGSESPTDPTALVARQ